MTKKIIREKLVEAIKQDPHRKYIKKVSIFGSYAKGRPSKRSDIDVLIEFTPRAYITLFDLAEIQYNMKKSVGKKVDLVPRDGIHEFIKKEVLANAQTIYQKR